MNGKHEETAERFCKAIEKLAASPEHLFNFECYLSRHFEAWLEKYAAGPENLTAELEHFAGLVWEA